MEDLMEKIRTFFEAVAAGVFIGIAGTVFLSVENRVIGAFLFALGLLAILCFQLKLYTGAVGYIVYQKKNTLRYLFELLIIWAGNFAGTVLVGKMLLFTLADTVVDLKRIQRIQSVRKTFYLFRKIRVCLCH